MSVTAPHRWYQPAEPVRTVREQLAELLRTPPVPPKTDLLAARRAAVEAEMRLDTATRWPFWHLPDDGS
jgi:hypothetical protein